MLCPLVLATFQFLETVGRRPEMSLVGSCCRTSQTRNLETSVYLTVDTCRSAEHAAMGCVVLKFCALSDLIYKYVLDKLSCLGNSEMMA